MYRKFKKVVLGLIAHETPSIFFSRILTSEAVVYNSFFFSAQPFYGNYSTYSHTNTVISHVFAYWSEDNCDLSYQMLSTYPIILTVIHYFRKLLCKLISDIYKSSFCRIVFLFVTDELTILLFLVKKSKTVSNKV